jgi:hypothetical protein
MKKLIVLIAVAGLATAAAACGGGTSSSDKTATAGAGSKPTSAATAKPAATAAATKAAPTAAATKAGESPTESTEGTASAGTPSKAQLAKDVTDLKGIMQAVIAKAQAGDVQGTRDTEGTMDTAMEEVVKATRAVDPALADSLEKLELDIEAQADADNTDLTIIAKDAQAVPAILDQIVTKLQLSQ